MGWRWRTPERLGRVGEAAGRRARAPDSKHGGVGSVDVEYWGVSFLPSFVYGGKLDMAGGY